VVAGHFEALVREIDVCALVREIDVGALVQMLFGWFWSTSAERRALNLVNNYYLQYSFEKE
jgi:hypothetical protein